MAKILVTPRSISRDGHPALDDLRQAGHEVICCTPGQQPSEAELLEKLPGCAGYLAGVEPVSAKVLEAAQGLKVISRNGTGVNSIDLDAAERLGIQVCRTPGANARGVAELTLTHMLALARSVPFSDASLKADGWARRKGVELQGRTLGVVGCGAIGRQVAAFGVALGMTVLGYDVVEDAAFAASLAGFSYAPLGAVISEADVLTLHCPPTETGEPIIGAVALHRMKQGVLIVNTARADLVDDDALLAALESGRVAGVALDVFDPEPPEDRILLQHERVIASPHIGGFTVESVDRAVQGAVDNLLVKLGEER